MIVFLSTFISENDIDYGGIEYLAEAIGSLKNLKDLSLNLE